MTLRELSQLYYLKREIEMDRRRLEELTAKAENLSGGRLSGRPRSRSVESKLERYAAEMVDLAAIISAKQRRCLRERNRLERYISGIGDSRTRMIFTLRFVSGLSWRQVAAYMGGGNTDNNVCQACHRYLREKK